MVLAAAENGRKGGNEMARTFREYRTPIYSFWGKRIGTKITRD
jgi:hypothetical protein